jgi:streptogramin lyase
MDTLHDVFGDSKGNIWYTSHRSPWAGILDPRTGIVKEYKVPLIPGGFPGTHHVVVDKNGIGWFSENWTHNLTRLDPVTGEFKQMHIETTDKLNTAGFSNFAMTPDGYFWHGLNRNEIAKIDPETGKVVQAYPLTKNPTPYDNISSADGKFWAGGTPPGNGYNMATLIDLRTGKMLELDSGDVVHSAARGGFDLSDNAWFGGRDGVLVQIVNEMDQGKGAHIRTYLPPTPYFPYTIFYTAVPDHNGEIWGGVLQGLGFVRFNPKTSQWWVYNNPEPSALSRWVWVDNSTTPVTVWYADYHTGYIVRIQPRE